MLHVPDCQQYLVEAAGVSMDGEGKEVPGQVWSVALVLHAHGCGRVMDTADPLDHMVEG